MTAEERYEMAKRLAIIRAATALALIYIERSVEILKGGNK